MAEKKCEPNLRPLNYDKDDTDRRTRPFNTPKDGARAKSGEGAAA